MTTEVRSVLYPIYHSKVIMSSISGPPEVWIKTEPDWDGMTSGEETRPLLTEYEQIKVETDIIKNEPEHIKVEPKWEHADTSAAAARASPLAEHTVKDKFVIEPKHKQIPETSKSHVQVKEEEQSVKRELEREEAGPLRGRARAELAPGPARRAGYTTPAEAGPRGERRGRASTGERRHCCRTCNDKFKKSSTLKTHERIHTGERPFACGICNKQFTQSNHLKRHERIHSGEKSYSCGICKHTFTRMENLMIHERIHTGDKPFTCDICNQKFSYVGSLKSHKLTHSGIKLYSCSICGKKCTTSSNLKVHERSHTGNKPYACGICFQKFKKMNTLRKHERTHSKEKPNTHKS